MKLSSKFSKLSPTEGLEYSTHLLIRERPAMLKIATCRGACHGSTFSSCALSKEPGKGAPRRILKLFLRLFCEGPCLVVFQPSVDFCSQRQNGNLLKLTTMNLRAELHHSFKRNVYLKPSLSQHGLILSEIF